MALALSFERELEDTEVAKSVFCTVEMIVALVVAAAVVTVLSSVRIFAVGRESNGIFVIFVATLDGVVTDLTVPILFLNSTLQGRVCTTPL